jgi:hypothetical protein
MKQRTFTDSYGRRYMVTVYTDGAVSVLFPGGKTLDFDEVHIMAKLWTALAYCPLTLRRHAKKLLEDCK